MSKDMQTTKEQRTPAKKQSGSKITHLSERTLFFIAASCALLFVSGLGLSRVVQGYGREAAIVSNARRHVIGETVTSYQKTYQVTVHSVKNDIETAKKFHLPADKKLMVIDFEVKNIGSKEQNFTPVTQTFLRDEEVDIYQFLPGTVTTPIEAKILQPGESSRGQLGFVIINREIPLHFYIDTGWEDRGPMVYSFK